MGGKPSSKNQPQMSSSEDSTPASASPQHSNNPQQSLQETTETIGQIPTVDMTSDLYPDSVTLNGQVQGEQLKPLSDFQSGEEFMSSVSMEMAQTENEAAINQLVNSVNFPTGDEASSYVNAEEMNTFNISNGMDSSETEAAVANIL